MVCCSADLHPEPLELLADRQPLHRNFKDRIALPQLADQTLTAPHAGEYHDERGDGQA
jgi:hypothetical protein